MGKYRDVKLNNETYKKIPSILGKNKSIEDWESSRRLELLERFEHEVYGTMPKTGYSIDFSIENRQEVLEGLAEKRKICGCISVNDNQYKFEFVLLIPKHKQGKVPVNIMIYNDENGAPPKWAEDIYINQELTNPFWPAKLLIECGMASAIFRTSEFESDNKDTFPGGLVKFFNENLNEEYSGGCISAWAFGVSRIIDYLVKCEEIDERYISITGHSRCGKTALWAGAMDKRIQCVFVNNSGCTGAAMSKLTKGENISQITEVFPHWFADNYRKYANKEETMDFDQHMLLGLIAPRLIYVASGSEDYWSGPDAEFAGAYLASEVYNAYDLPGLVLKTNEKPEIRQPLHDGRIGYHIRPGGHDLSLFDWMMFLSYLKSKM